MTGSYCLSSCAHRRSGREAVVDEDDNAVGEIQCRSIVAVRALATRELRCFLARDALDRGFGNAVPAHDVRIQHANAAGGDGAHRQLSMTRCPQLAHEEHVERSVKRRRDFKRDRDAAARQREHDDIVAAGVVLKTRGQHAARDAAIDEGLLIIHADT